MNAIPHHSTKFAPVQLMLGKRVDLNRGIITPWPEHTPAIESIEGWLQETSDELTMMSEQARTNINTRSS